MKESYTFPSRNTAREGGHTHIAPTRRVRMTPNRRMGRTGGRGVTCTLSHRHLHAAVPRLGNLVAGGNEKVFLPVVCDLEGRKIHPFCAQ